MTTLFLLILRSHTQELVKLKVRELDLPGRNAVRARLREDEEFGSLLSV